MAASTRSNSRASSSSSKSSSRSPSAPASPRRSEFRVGSYDVKVTWEKIPKEKRATKPTEDTTGGWGEHVEPGNAWDTEEREDWNKKQATPAPITSVFEQDPAIQPSIKSTKLLEGTEFYRTAEGQAAVPVPEQQNFLREAHFLAQLAWHDVYQRHLPEIWFAKYLYGPEMVLFGKGDLLRELGEGYYDKLAVALPSGVWSHTISKALDDATFLRNNICHAQFCRSCDIDGLLAGAQRFVCVLGDDARALRIREVRDRFKALVQDEYRKLADCKPLEKAPALHQQATFSNVAFGEYKFADAIKKPAAEWAQMYVMPGVLRPERRRSDSARDPE